MKTINQRGMTLRQYDEHRRGEQAPPLRAHQPCEFEDDALADIPSRIPPKITQHRESVMRAIEPAKIVKFDFSFIQIFGYFGVFMMYWLMGLVAVIVGSVTSPTPNAPIPTFFVFMPMGLGVLGVIIQHKINQRRRRKQQENFTRRR